MKVLVPLNNKEHIKDYVEAGAEEFYIGFYDQKWYDQFGEYADINRMSGFKKTANPFDFEEVVAVIQEVKSLGAFIYVTFNSSVYNDAQLEIIKDYMQVLKKAHVDGVIVSCMELVQMANEIGVSSVVSTISGVYNSDIARFYQDLGAKRIILPRDLSLEEIEAITKAVSEVEYEVFMMRNGCRFSDSHCLGFHRSEKPSICSYIGGANRKLHMKEENFKTKHEAELNDMMYTQSFHNNACGLCSIYRFVKLGITAGKIVGRSDEWQYVCQDIAYVKKNVALAKACESEEEYLAKMTFPENSTFMCKLGLSCYYPEVRF